MYTGCRRKPTLPQGGMKMRYEKFKARCEDCACLVQKNGQWCCDECFGQPCESITDCPEGIEPQEIAELDAKAKANKIQHGAKAEKATKRKPPKKEASDEKKELFSCVLDAVSAAFGENVQVLRENKLIFVQIGEKKFKIDIIQQRK